MTNSDIEVASPTSAPNVEFWARFVEQRREERLDFRTTGHAFELADSGMTPQSSAIRIWTIDVSTMGAKILCERPIESKRLLVHLYMPQLRDSLIEAGVKRSFTEQSQYITGKQRTIYVYGLQFFRILSKDAVELSEEIENSLAEDEPASPDREVSLQVEESTLADDDRTDETSAAIPLQSVPSPILIAAAVLLGVAAVAAIVAAICLG